MLAKTAVVLLLAAGGPVRGEVSGLHPRIYARADGSPVGKGPTVSVLRARRSDPAYARWLGSSGSSNAAAMVERASRYLESSDASDLAAVREFLRTRTYSYEKNDVSGFLAGAEMAIAYDWTWSGLSRADRAAALANIVATADSSARFLRRGGPDINHNYTYMALDTVTVCGLVLKGEAAPYDARAGEYLALAKTFLEGRGKVLDTWKAREGAWAEGSHYTFHETLRTLVLTLAAWRSASDSDYFPIIRRRYGDFMAKAGRWLIACTRPDMTFERTGDSLPSRVVAGLTVPGTVEMMAAGIDDPAESARLRSFAQALLAAYGENAVAPDYNWAMRVFYDPRAPDEPSYRTLPLFQRLGTGTAEQFSLRNGWGPDSTAITILAGNHFTDHQHFDKGQFLIYHRGGLAVDSGTYDRMYQADRHSAEYAPRTLAHNCLLVYNPDQAFPKGYTNDGGQLVIRNKQHHGDWPAYLAHLESEGLHAGEVTAAELDPGNRYAWTKVDLHRAYGEKVSHYERQFAYLPEAGLLVVYDRVASARPEFEKCWLLHFQDPPSVDGKPAEPGVHSAAGARIVAERRKGKLELGGPPIKYDGALFVHTLLPAERVITTIGGPGYEYYNAFTGRNYPVSSARLEAEIREAGRWRMEVAPASKSVEDEFLNAIEIRDGSARPGSARLIRATAGKAAGVHLHRPAGRDEVVLFAAGDLPLRYTVRARAACDHLITGLRPLAGVEVAIGGRMVARRQASAQGVLRFEDKAAGARNVTVRAAAKETVTFPEDFSAGMDRWWVEGGDRVWVEDGRLHVDADRSVATVWCRTPHPPDFQLDLDAHVVSSSVDANNINLFFSYSDPAGRPLEETRESRRTAGYDLYHKLSGYIVTFLNDTQAEKARVRIRRDPGFHLLAEKFGGECRAGVTYHLRAIKRGGHIAFQVDGREVLKAEDSNPLGAGLLGLRTYRTNLWWDNVRVSLPHP